MLTKRFSYLLTALLIVNFCQSQETGVEVARMQFQAKQIIPPSPEAAELGKYGNVPVSLFTGTPNINIPLVQLQGNVLSLPVSLSYNSSGLKPEDIAPWTGLGWALNAGGVITRSVSGDPDVENNYFISPSPLDPVPTDELSKQNYFSAIRLKQKETQPDVYYYNFMGHSGKFLITPEGQIFQKEKNLLSISGWTPGYSENTFIIFDENGVKYEFTDLEKTFIVPVDDQPNAPPMINRYFTSAWYLTKVTAPYGNEELNFEYYSPTNAQSTISTSVLNRSISYSITDDGSPWWQSVTPSGPVNLFYPPAISITKKFIKKVTHKKNAVITGYIDFESGLNERLDLGQASFNGERLLKKVKLFTTQNSVNTLIKEFDLSYEYFGASQSGPLDYKRLKLKKVQEISPDPVATVSKPPYDFFYKNETYPMPPRFSSGLDHWGYYIGFENVNGNGSTPTLIPTVNVAYPYLTGPKGEGANREAHEDGSSLGIIEKINYPTGGYTSFEYEGNDGYIWNTTIGLPVGGLRIKKMTDFSSPGKQAVVKTYEYKKEDGNSSGFTGILPRYDEGSDYQVNANCGHNDKTYTVTLSSNSIYGLGSVQGSHIGYTRVTEYQMNIDNPAQSLGKTVYTYKINGFSEIDDDLGNGDLTKQQAYNASGKLLVETENFYNYEYGAFMINRRLLPDYHQSSRTRLCINGSSYSYYDPATCSSIPSCTGGTNVPVQYNVTENQIIWQGKKLTKQTQTVYDQLSNDYLTTVKEFSFGNPNHNYPTLTQETNSASEKIFTSVKYGIDYTNSCGGSLTTGSMSWDISDMIGKHMLLMPVEKVQYRQDAAGNKRYINGVITDYQQGNAHLIYYLQAKPLLTSLVPSETCGNSFNMNSNYRLAATMNYDNDGNLKEQSKTNDVISSYLWGYGGLYPVAKITGRSQNDMITLSGISQAVLDNPSSETALKTELNKLRTVSGAFVSTYTYKPGIGISTETDPRGRVTYYEYDVLNRLILVRDNENKILKKICYNYAGQAETCISSGGCINTTPDWQNVPNGTTCEVVNGANTGYQFVQQTDNNPCSISYGNPRIITVYNPSICPPPVVGCGTCTGEDKKCINNVCETGVLKIISTRRVKTFGPPDENGYMPVIWLYYCTSAYCFSDHTTSTPVETQTSALCTVDICQ